MPEKQDKFNGVGVTEEQAQKFIKWVESKQDGATVCSVCKKTAWIVGEIILAPPSHHPKGGMNIGGPTYPLIPIFCSNCGHALFFNALSSGILEEQKIPEEKKDAAGNK
jgi:hypothetical protein